jgi:hypothetical protein
MSFESFIQLKKDEFETEDSYNTYLSDIKQGLELGTLVFKAHDQTGLLYQISSPGLIQLDTFWGEFDLAAMKTLLLEVQAIAQVIMYDEKRFPGLGLMLGYDLKFVNYSRLRFIHPLAPGRGFKLKQYPEHWLIRSWQESDLSQTIDLVVKSNTNTLGGLFLTLPQLPTANNLAQATQKIVTDRLIPEASISVLDGDRVIGLLLCVDTSPLDLPKQSAMLMEMVVAEEARGYQLSGHLVVGMEQALIGLGYPQVEYLTTGDNAPVLKLFDQDKLSLLEEEEGWIWQKRG